MRHAEVALATSALAIVMIAGCSASADPPSVTQTPSPTPTVTLDAVGGSVAVEADFVGNVRQGNTTVGGPCLVKAGYDDQKAGAQVVVTGADGEVLGVGEMKSSGLQIIDGSTSMSDTWCGFFFTVTDIPTDRKFYGVAVGSRDPYQLSAEEAFDPVRLTLGDVPQGAS